jgi:hypothetical protein
MAKKKTKPAKTAAKKKSVSKPSARPAIDSGGKAGLNKNKTKAPARKTKPDGGGVATHSPSRLPAAASRAVLHALVIGCDCYLPNRTEEGMYPSLNGCVRDADQVEQFLRQRAGLVDDRLIKLTSTSDGRDRPKESQEKLPTYKNMVAAFRAITSRAGRGDHVYIHYSGHGGRCPTIVPKIKGKEGLDESLVPIDIGDPKAQYLRDVEIAKLLKEMDDKGLVVTVVLDSCHSGGATRAALRAAEGVAVRGVSFVDHKSRPASLVGTPEQLAAVAPPLGGTRAAMDGTRGMAATVAERGCVVVAACRPSESANEYRVDGTHTQGALTYWYLDTIAHGREDITFRTAFDAILARVHSQFAAQTPMLFGNQDRRILGGVAQSTTIAFAVNGVSNDGRTVTLGTGQAALVRDGAEFAIYPPAADLADTSARTATIRVNSVGATTSTAEVTKVFDGRKIQVGYRAVAVGTDQKLVRNVRVSPTETAPVSAAKFLRHVEEAVKNQTWIELAGATDTADFIVTTSEDGKRFVICDPGGEPFAIEPELATSDDGAAKAVVARLIHLARFQAIRGLDNPDPFSPLRGKLAVELQAAPKKYHDGDPLTDLKKLPHGKVPRVKPGDWLVVSITNRATRDMNVTILDLASDWSVSIIPADERFRAIDANGGSWQLPLKARLAEGRTSGKDILKIIATLDPPPDYEQMRLPPLDQPIPRQAEHRSAFRGLGTPQTALDELLAAVSADRPTRAFSTGGQATAGWTVGHVEVEIA